MRKRIFNVDLFFKNNALFNLLMTPLRGASLWFAHTPQSCRASLGGGIFISLTASLVLVVVHTPPP